MGPGHSQHQSNTEMQRGLSTPASRRRDNPLPGTGRPGTTAVDDPLTSDIAKIIGRIIGRLGNTRVENPGTSDIAKIIRMPLVVHYEAIHEDMDLLCVMSYSR